MAAVSFALSLFQSQPGHTTQTGHQQINNNHAIYEIFNIIEDTHTHNHCRALLMIQCIVWENVHRSGDKGDKRLRASLLFAYLSLGYVRSSGRHNR